MGEEVQDRKLKETFKSFQKLTLYFLQTTKTRWKDRKNVRRVVSSNGRRVRLSIVQVLRYAAQLLAN